MSENDDIEKKLGEYRESRDEGLPADRRLLPVHKDRLLAEARRRYGAKESPGWIAFFRPVVRGAAIAVPILILAIVVFLWYQASPLARRARLRHENQLALLKSSGSGQAGERRQFSGKEKGDANAKPAPSEAAASTPAAPAVTSTLAGAVGGVAQNEPAQMASLDLSGQYRSRSRSQSESKRAQAYLSDDRDRSGFEKDEKNADKGVASGGKAASRFSNFKLVQSSDTITLVDGEGSTYAGRIVQPQQVGNYYSEQQNAKTKAKPQAQTREKQNNSNLIQQVNLVGTNQLTREVVTLVASFYAAEPETVGEPEVDKSSVARETESATGRADAEEQSKPADEAAKAPMSESEPKPNPVAAPVPQKKQLTDKLQQAQMRASNAQGRVQNNQIAARVNVVLERIDQKNNRQERVADAERFGQ